MKSSPIVYSTLILLFITCFHIMDFNAMAQKPPAASNEKDKEDAQKTSDEFSEQNTFHTLDSIISGINELEGRRKKEKRNLRQARTDEQKAAILSEMKKIHRQIGSHKKDFERIATGVDPEIFESGPGEEFDWQQEVLDLLGPVLQELKTMTARPRQIEKLRSLADYYRNQLKIITKALTNLKMLISKTDDRKIRNQLKVTKNDWEIRSGQIENQLTIVKYQLDEKAKEKKSIIESTQNVVRIFFKSRGRNLFFAIVTFFSVFLALRIFYRLIYRFSPLHRQGRRSFYVRLADVFYHFLTAFGAFGTSLIVLYVSGDWVLLSISIIFLLGIGWTARQGLARFWEQIKLLLNLGTVREDERLIYNGIPWKVISLNLYSHLENPALQIGHIRLPLRDLVDLASRPCMQNDPWFPCKLYDWIILSDNIFGQVVAQTPDMVQVKQIGGSIKTYNTLDFLSLNPENLSVDFRLRILFGIDYAHQAQSTNIIPKKMTKFIRGQLKDEGYGGYVKKFRVEFIQAGASSLDMEILADFSGKAARYYNRLSRLLQRMATDACNYYGWVIPFTQLTLHQADANESKSSENYNETLTLSYEEMGVKGP